MRMQLTEEEAKVILRMREVENAHRAGWNKAHQGALARWEMMKRVLTEGNPPMQERFNKALELTESSIQSHTELQRL